MSGQKKVLVVEDNELNQKLFCDLLGVCGAQVVQTRDGNNILALVREENPDLILMDIQLPQVNGLDITADLKKENDLKHIPVIAVTAFAMKGDEDKIRQGGCEDYISKPISVPDFMDMMKKYLD